MYLKEKNINLWNKIIGAYIFITILCYLLFMIAPIVSLIIHTPIYSFQKYLGIIASLLIVLDLMFTKNTLKGKNIYLLYGVLFSSFISSLLTYRYGIKDNLFNIVWMLIYISLFYTYYLRIDKKNLKEILYKFYKYVSSFFAVMCLLSISSFVYNTGYTIVSNPYYSDSVTRQGFIENRLFGVFLSINSAAILSGVLLICGIFYFIQNKKKWTLIYNIIFIIYIILSGTRSTMLSLLLVLSVGIFYYLYSYKLYGKKIFYKIIISALGVLFSIVIVYFGIEASKKILVEIPKISIFYNNRDGYKKLIENYHINIASLGNSVGDNKESKENILSRKDVTVENISNNRVAIWRDYLSIYKEIGIVGLSPNNYSEYLHENSSELYIVKYIKENYPNMYKEKDVYHPHNSYLMIYVAGGIIGIALFIIFMVLYFMKIIKCRKTSSVYIYLNICILLFILSNMMFDTIVFFNNDITPCIFWLALGSSYKFINDK